MESVQGDAESQPRKAGKYELLTRLSQGGMAELYLAFASGPGGFRKFVAVKRIHPEVKQQPDVVRMFLDEARITASLWHSNICQVFDLDGEGEELYLAMEYIPGQNLKELVRACRGAAKPLPLGLTCRIISEAALGLHHAHQFTDASGKAAPIIHRDVTPKNVMITYNGQIKLIDFGIAQIRYRLERTKSGQVKGTAGYLSPEQIRSEPLDGRSDLFSLGIIFYELACGQRLFYSANSMEMISRTLQGEIPSPRDHNPDMSEALEQVLLKALSRDLDQRFKTGKEFSKAIESAAASVIFDEERATAFMYELFSDQICKTRAVLTGHHQDVPALRDAAEALIAAHESTAKIDSREMEVTRLIPDAPSATSQVHPSPSVPDHAQILVVDDSPTILEMVKACLPEPQYQVVGLSSAGEALKFLEQKLPDLMVLDLMMPEMSGFELCRRVREQATTHYMPILFLSAACSLQERIQCLNVGGDDFIHKPFEPDELTARIRAHLQRVSALRGARQS